MKRFLEIGISTIMVTIVSMVAFLLITSKVPLFGIRTFTVVTGSMQPTVSVGSIIFTKTMNTYHVGDVIAFQKGDVTISHRIVTAKNGIYTTKGDANNTPDSTPVTMHDVVGKTIAFLPAIGKFAYFLKTLPGFLLFIVLPTLLFIGFHFKHFIKEIEKEVIKKITDGSISSSRA